MTTYFSYFLIDTYNVSSSIIPTTDKEFHQPVVIKNKDDDKDGDTKKKISVHTGKQKKISVHTGKQKNPPAKNKKVCFSYSFHFSVISFVNFFLFAVARNLWVTT